MVQYLVILLDDTSVSFCHYANESNHRRLMPVEMLKAGILYGMKENLNIQFVYPDYDLPDEYNRLIETVDHIKIKPASLVGDADVAVINGMKELATVSIQSDKVYVLRLDREELFANGDWIINTLRAVARLNIVLTDVDGFVESDYERYRQLLASWATYVEQEYVDGKSPQINILTDRMMLDKMNNCGAGDTTITLAPDGRFYVCPAFYTDADGYAVGDLAHGLDIKNGQLYKLAYAPICRRCDAYQCRRCIWLNRKTTLEVNTPSHEQCVVAHIERNASRRLLIDMRQRGTFMPDKEEIKEITYTDPFETNEEW